MSFDSSFVNDIQSYWCNSFSEHYSSPSNHSHSDHDTDSGFTSHPSMDDFCTIWDDDEDSHPRSPHGSELDHESHSEHETHVCHKKYRQPATLKALNLVIGPWVCLSHFWKKRILILFHRKPTMWRNQLNNNPWLNWNSFLEERRLNTK